MVSASTPPPAGSPFPMADTYGIDERSTDRARRATLPEPPPPVRYSGIRSRAPCGGTAPWWTTVPSASRTAGPKTTEEPSTTNTRSCGPRPAKLSTCLHSSQPSSVETSSRRGPVPSITGVPRSGNAWPATPSETPRSSPRTISPCTAAVVPPTVEATMRSMRGEAL
jgi:hypothetical protein